jgi:hypothetical protein
VLIPSLPYHVPHYTIAASSASGRQHFFQFIRSRCIVKKEEEEEARDDFKQLGLGTRSTVQQPLQRQV